MKRPLFVSNLRVALLVPLLACSGDSPIDFGSPAPGPYRLTLEGDASFRGPHQDHSISVVVVHRDLGLVVAEQTVTISPTEDPAFVFTFSRLLAEGTDHDVYYWIDSNIGGGSAVTCDPPENDHQWRVTILNPRAGIELSESHDDDVNTEVCFIFNSMSIE